MDYPEWGEENILVKHLNTSNLSQNSLQQREI